MLCTPVCVHVRESKASSRAHRLNVHFAPALSNAKSIAAIAGTLPAASLDSLWTRPIGLRNEIPVSKNIRWDCTCHVPIEHEALQMLGDACSKLQLARLDGLFWLDCFVAPIAMLEEGCFGRGCLGRGRFVEKHRNHEMNT